MKTIASLTLLLSFLFSFGQAEIAIDPKAFVHHAIAGYGLNNLGKSAHVVYALEYKKNLLYGGIRIQENAFDNPLLAENNEVYRSDVGGSRFGFLIGYQRNFHFKGFNIVPLLSADLEYAYLGSWENIPLYNNNGNFIGIFREEMAARSLWLPGLNVGFEANIYRGLYLKQIIGCTALFDTRYSRQNFNDEPFSSFNGLLFGLRVSVAYRF